MLRAAMHKAVGPIRERRWRRLVEFRFLCVDASRPPALITNFDDGPVLVVAPHMDDETIGLGGTILRHHRAGAAVTVLFLTDGSRGNAQLSHDPQLTAQRKDEARRASELLGAPKLLFLDCPDRALRADGETVGRISDVLVEVQPRIIYVPSIFDTHPDHIAAACAVSAALAATSRRMTVSPLCREYEVWAPLVPNRLVDITDVLGTKLEALRKFESQLEDIDYLNVAEGLGRYRSLYHLHGRGAAEAFCELSVRAHRDLVRRVHGGGA